jgi:hypothetical protein
VEVFMLRYRQFQTSGIGSSMKYDEPVISDSGDELLVGVYTNLHQLRCKKYLII